VNGPALFEKPSFTIESRRNPVEKALQVFAAIHFLIWTR
jgi:hypothetical protein